MSNVTVAGNVIRSGFSNKSPLQLIFDMAFFLLLSIIILTFLILLHCRKKKSEVFGPVTRDSSVPNWVPRFDKPTSTNKARIYSHSRQIQSILNDIPRVYDQEIVIPKIQEIVDWIYGKTLSGHSIVKISPKTSIVSVSMPNFVYGNGCNQFEPVNGATVDSYYTYQYIGGQRIQVTSYVEDGVSYVAGFCIFIKNPYIARWEFSEKRIRELFAGTKYQPMWNDDRDTLGLGEVARKTLDREVFSDWKADPLRMESIGKLIKTLELKMCKELGKPVLIGMHHQKMMHFEWNDEHDDYEVDECATCASEDLPPSYQSVVEAV